MGLVGLYFTFDGKSSKCFEQMGGVTWYMLKDHSGCCVENWPWWARVEVIEGDGGEAWDGHAGSDERWSDWAVF